ncbi:MAG: hypothetical protein ACRBBP_05665 [Bdellovibrionales bacterium]
MKLISSKLLENEADSGELFLLLYTLESLVHKGKGFDGLFNMTNELKPYESVITKLLLRLVSAVKPDDQDLLNSIPLST